MLHAVDIRVVQLILGHSDIDDVVEDRLAERRRLLRGSVTQAAVLPRHSSPRPCRLNVLLHGREKFVEIERFPELRVSIRKFAGSGDGYQWNARESGIALLHVS